MSDFAIGKYRNYSWIQIPSVDAFELVDNLGLLQSHFLCVTSCDSQELILSDTFKKMGWRKLGRAAIAPMSIEVEEIPEGGDNEWYFFSNTPPVEIGTVEVFSTKGGFLFSEDCNCIDMQARFWAQLCKIDADAYISELAITLFATKEDSLFQRSLQFLTGKGVYSPPRLF